MKKLTLRLAFFAMATSLALAVTSCGSDDPAPASDQSSLTAPTAISNVAVGNGTTDVSFDVKTPDGYKSAEVTAVGGTAAIKSQPAAGDKTGALVVTFTAGSTITAGALTAIVTDNNGNKANATAILSIGNYPTELTGVISESRTLTANKKWLLKGNVYVASGAELTIEAGTVILGDKVTKGALIISRGAKIHAIGTAAKPIVFTSSNAVNGRNYGDWGGVVILGKAQNNQSASQIIEGISAASGDNGLHGGTLDDDNSGEFQYARIEFAGIALATDNELNGLTMGSVGNATKIDHVQVSYSGDDSFEWFGGTVNGAYLIAYRGWDDDFDTDFGYRGTNQFLVSYRDPNQADKSGSNGFESDNDAEGDAKTPQTAATFANVTFFGPFMYAKLTAAGALVPGNVSGNYKRGAHIRRNTALKVYNSVFAGANVDGIFFEKASAGVVFKGNFIGRMTGNPFPTPTANDPALTNYDASNFATDNIVLSPATTVDVTSYFAGSTANLWSLTTPTALLATGSPLLDNAKAATLPTFPVNGGFNAGFNTTVKYIGAFDATTNWASGTWVNYDPGATAY